MQPIQLFASVCTVALLFANASTSYAQDYPSRPVTIVVPLSPGSTVDALGRIYAGELSKKFGQPFTVENRPGIIACRVVKYSSPDAHSLLWHSSGATSAQTVLKEPDFDITTGALDTLGTEILSS